MFFISQLLIGLFIAGLASFGLSTDFFESAAGTTLLSALVYLTTIAILLVSGTKVKRLAADRKILGIKSWLSWSDIGIGVLAVLPYFILSGVVAALVVWLSGGSELNQNQSIAFEDVRTRLELMLAFFTLVVVAPLSEELVFRGYYFGKLRAKLSAIATIIISAVVFGLLHLPGAVTENGIDLQTAAALDTMILGLVLGGLREWTGSIWAGFVLHMAKNAIAFYFLFIYPQLGGTL